MNSNTIRELNLLSKEIYQDNKAKGFWDERRSDAECIALMHSELSEALEAARHDYPESTKTPPHGQLEEELADCIIRILDFCGRYNLKIGDVIYDKLEYNKTRPYKHGKKF